MVLGALPMANVLAVGILIGQRRPGSRPFLLGFEAFGAMALALFLALEFLPRCGSVILRRTICEWTGIMGPSTFRFHPIAGFVGAVMLGLPQVAFALIGGFLSRRFRVTITPR